MKRPRQRRPAALPKARAFNECVGVDVVKGPAQQPGSTTRFLNVVDWATGLQRIGRIRSERPQDIRRAYRRLWLQPFGRPDVIVADQHGEFKGNFAKRCRLEGSRIHRIPLEAPWQNSRTERAGQRWLYVFKRVLAEVVPRDDGEYEECVIQAQNAGSSLGRRGRYSPDMLVFGKEQALPGILTDFEREKNLPYHSQITADEILARTSEIRSAARKAQVKGETAKGLRRAILADPRGYPGPFLAGDVVVIWGRKLMKGRKRVEAC